MPSSISAIVFRDRLKRGVLQSFCSPSTCQRCAANHDRYLIEHAESAMHSWEADAFPQLTPEHLDWLKTLPFSLVWHADVYLCHATPKDDQTYWLEVVKPDGSVVSSRVPRSKRWRRVFLNPSSSAATHTCRARCACRMAADRQPRSVGCPAYDDDTPYYHRVEAGTPLASYPSARRRTAIGPSRSGSCLTII